MCERVLFTFFSFGDYDALDTSTSDTESTSSEADSTSLHYMFKSWLIAFSLDSFIREYCNKRIQRLAFTKHPTYTPDIDNDEGTVTIRERSYM